MNNLQLHRANVGAGWSGAVFRSNRHPARMRKALP